MKKTFTGEDFSKIRRFLCIGAHCDDTEIRAGTIARRLIRQGAEGTEWTMIDCPWCGALESGPDSKRAFRPGMSLAANPEQYILEEYRSNPGPAVIPL